ncbi:MAG TPA: endo-polygalacturonase [Verrucomicrobia subdivision 3 bacterium]|nr:endo-polygalacturonase [Limisphaerales bacterium]
MKTYSLIRRCFLLTGLIVSSALCAAEAPPNQTITYPAPEGGALNTDFTVKVRTPTHDWQEVAAYLVKVDAVIGTKHTPLNSSMAYFDFTGIVDVSITFNRGNIQSARVRPLSFGIAPKVNGNTITFSLSEPRNLSVELNGDIFHNLQLFANPIETNRPASTDPNVIYFGPGIHQLDGGMLNVPSGKTMYIAGGAVVRGQLLCSNVHDVHILGRGMLYESRGGVRIVNSTNVVVSGIVVVPSGNTVLVGQSQNVTLESIKSISCGGNYDGIDIFCSSNVVIEGVFMRNSDDCIAIYGHRRNFYGNVQNITVRNSTLWADVAHPILVGTHGDTPNPDTLEDLRFSNLDILDHMEPQIDYQGCMSLNAGDGNLIRNVRFENIRVENFRQGQLVNLRVFYNRKYNTSPGRGIENVYFKNITYNGSHAENSVIAGYDDTRNVKNVVFENLVINGTLISNQMTKPGWYKTSDMARFFVGEHVEGLVFRKSTNNVAQKLNSTN